MSSKQEDSNTSVSINSKYKLLRTSNTRYYCVLGGRASGKSFAVALNLLLLTYEKGHTILFTRYTLTAAEISIIPEFIGKIELMGKGNDFEVTKSSITNKVTGSKILFRGIKASSGLQTANLKSIADVTTWVLDEAEELVDENVFDKIDESIRTLGILNRVILIMNPTTKQHFIYNKFFRDNGITGGYNGIKGDVTYIHTTYLDNIDNLSKSWIAKAEKLKLRRPEDYNNRFLGAWLDKASGVVFDNWMLGEFKETNKCIFAQDYGFKADASTLVKISIDEDNKLIYLKECFYSHGMTTGDLFIANKTHAGNNLIIADSAEQRLISELDNLGNNIEPCKKGPGSVNFGIKLMQGYNLIVDHSSDNLIIELKNYVWANQGEKPIDSFNHILDPCRYGVSYLIEENGRNEYHVW
jgi:phage terminase large subunit